MIPVANHRKWYRAILLSVLAYEAAGSLVGGSLLILAPDGRLMDMPVKIIHGAFRDFLIPGIILFALGILTAIAFLAVLKRAAFNKVITAFALGGLLIWFGVEIAILQMIHWLHIMWGLPVVIGIMAAIRLSPRIGRNNTIGFYAAVVSFAAAISYSIIQLLQVLQLILPPWDTILIYSFSLCIAPPFLVAMLALHYTILPERKIFTQGALLFAAIYTAFAYFVYTIQLAVALPLSLSGKAVGMQVIVLTEHSFFWALDALAYINMGIATFFAAFALGKNTTEKWLKWFFLLNGLLTPVIAFVYFYPHFSTSLLMLASPWMITCPGSLLLLALYFWRKRN